MNKEDFALFLEYKETVNQKLRKINWIMPLLFLQIVFLTVIFGERSTFYIILYSVIFVEIILVVLFHIYTTKSSLVSTWKMWFDKKSIVLESSEYLDFKFALENYISKQNEYYNATLDKEDKRVLRNTLITTTKPIYDILNDDDKKLFVNYKKRQFYLAIFRIVVIIAIIVILTYVIIYFFPDNNILLFLWIFLYIVLLTKLSTDQPIDQFLFGTDAWVVFCKNKSIPLQAHDYYSIKLSIDDHVSNHENYYSD